MQDPRNRQKFTIWAPSHNLVGQCPRNEGIDNRKKLVKYNASPTCPRNMVNFGTLAAEICW